MNRKKSKFKKAVMIGCGFVNSASAVALMQVDYSLSTLIDADKK